MKAIATLALIGAAYGAQENHKGFLRGIDKPTLLKVGSKIAGLDDNELLSFTNIASAVSGKVGEFKQEAKKFGDKVSEDVKNDSLVQNTGKIVNALSFEDHDLYSTVQELKNDPFVKNVEKMYNQLKALGFVDQSIPFVYNEQFILNVVVIYSELKARGLVDNEFFFGDLASAVSNKAGEIKQETKNLGDKVSQDAKNDKFVQNMQVIGKALGFEDHSFYSTVQEFKNDQFIKNAEKMFNELKALGFIAQDIKNDQFIKNIEKMYSELMALGWIDKAVLDIRSDQFIINVLMIYTELKAKGLVDNEFFFGDLASAVSNKAGEIKQETKNLGNKISQDAKNDKFVQNMQVIGKNLGFEDHDLYTTVQELKNDPFVKNVEKMYNQLKALGFVDQSIPFVYNEQFILNFVVIYSELKARGLVDNEFFFGDLASAVSNKANEVKQETKNLGDKVSQDAKNDKFVQNMQVIGKALSFEDNSLVDLQKLLSDASKTVGDAKKNPKNYGELLNDAIDIVKDIKRKDDFQDSHFMRPNYNTGRQTGGKMWGL